MKFYLSENDFIIMTLINNIFVNRSVVINKDLVEIFKQNIQYKAIQCGYILENKENSDEQLAKLIVREENGYSLNKNVSFNEIKRWFLKYYNVDLIVLFLVPFVYY